MKYKSHVRGRPQTRPATPSVLRDRKKRIDYYNKRDPLDLWASVTLGNLQRRCRIRGLACTLTRDDLLEMLLETRMICPVLGIPLKIGRGRLRARDDSVSIDRKNNDHGYHRPNCGIISFKANTCKNRLTRDEIAKLLAYCDRIVSK